VDEVLDIDDEWCVYHLYRHEICGAVYCVAEMILLLLFTLYENTKSEL
jgi:hypothetical protein